MVVAIAHLFACTFAVVAVVRGESVSKGWGDIPGLLSGSVDEFHSLVDPLANMTVLAYVTTNGTYYNEKKLNETVDGFNKDKELSVEQANGGMRAIVFVDEAAGRVGVVYRGTDLNFKTRGGRLDICFDSIMAMSKEHSAFCDKFSAKELDYYTQAKKVMQATLDKYHNMSTVVTGHSLGCALAGLMAIEFRDKNVTGVCFSLPGVLKYAVKQTGVSAGEIRDMENIHVLSDTQDPITLEAVIADVNFGQYYMWPTAALSDCRTCCCALTAAGDTVSMTLATCKACFSSKHSFVNYVHHLIGNSTIKAQPIAEPSSIIQCRVCEDKPAQARNSDGDGGSLVGADRSNAGVERQGRSSEDAQDLEGQADHMATTNALDLTSGGDVDDKEASPSSPKGASSKSKVRGIALFSASFAVVLLGFMVATAFHCKNKRKSATSRVQYLELEEASAL